MPRGSRLEQTRAQEATRGQAPRRRDHGSLGGQRGHQVLRTTSQVLFQADGPARGPDGGGQM